MQERYDLDLIPNTKNILRLPEAEQFECKLFNFVLGVAEQPTMWIRFVNMNDVLVYQYFVLVGAYFMDGPTSWLSANFNVASEDECLQVLDKLQWTGGWDKDMKQEMLKIHKLIYVDSIFPEYRIRFLVKRAYITDELPPHFASN